MYDELIEPLRAGATVLTPNRRLAQAVRRAFDLAQAAQGRATWPAADCLPWNAWLARGYRDALFAGAARKRLATPQQERYLWWSVVSDSPEADGLMAAAATADAAAQAWELAHAWHLLPALNHMTLAEEGAAFLRWAAAFDRRCTELSLLDQARLPDAVQDLVRTGQLAVPKQTFLLGFDLPDPQQRAVADALREAGSNVHWCARRASRTSGVELKAADADSEVRAAACWVRDRLEKNPAARIGVIVPDLTRLRSRLLRIFDDVLVPEAALHPGREQPRPWNVSLGTPLSEWPLVHAALIVLDLAVDDLPAERASALLRSAFLGGAQAETDARALLDARLRGHGDPRVSLGTLDYYAGQAGPPHQTAELARRLAEFRRRRDELPRQARPVSWWGPELQRLLVAIGWPGERTLDSTEYQTFSAWKELLAELAQLDAVSPPIHLRDAISLIGRIARERVFQPESPPVPIQILGPLEAVELDFDHVWVLGLTDESWPRAPRPNALLPVELQRTRGTPRSSADWELGFARRLQAGWEAAADEVVFSWHESADDRELSKSPLLFGYPGATLEQLGVAAPPDWRREMHSEARIDLLADWACAALPDPTPVKGGSRVLQAQAACPFQAFAGHRLKARPLEQPEDGLSKRDRGTVLHMALAKLWSDLGSSQRLHDIAASDLDATIERAVDAGMARVTSRRSSSLQEQFIALERRRLAALLHEWLEVERERPPFEVLASEQKRNVGIGGLALELRLDRVDRVGDDVDMLIDYKSGQVKIADWFGDRPDEPQVPLYAVTHEGTPGALAFARVARGECRLVGQARTDGVALGVKPYVQGKPDDPVDWDERIAAWRVTLERLAQAFRSGRAPVDPKTDQACERCDFALICRVSEVVDRGAPTSTVHGAGDE